MSIKSSMVTFPIVQNRANGNLRLLVVRWKRSRTLLNDLAQDETVVLVLRNIVHLGSGTRCFWSELGKNPC